MATLGKEHRRGGGGKKAEVEQFRGKPRSALASGSTGRKDRVTYDPA